MRLTPQIESLMKGAEALGNLVDRFVFVGGGIVDLLLSDPHAPLARPTKDIDLIVELSTVTDYFKLTDSLRAKGFREDDQSSVICRWLINDLTVDIMPTNESILGFGNPWYESAIQHQYRVRLPNEIQISVINGPHFVATKLEAFSSRGGNDAFLSP